MEVVQPGRRERALVRRLLDELDNIGCLIVGNGVKAETSNGVLVVHEINRDFLVDVLANRLKVGSQEHPQPEEERNDAP